MVPSMKHFSHKRTFRIIVTQNNIFYIENFILECIINDNVFFHNDMFCCVLGMPPRLSIPNAESQQSVTESESENDEEVENAPILIRQLRFFESESRTPARTHENSITGDDSENSLGTGNESLGPLISSTLLTTEVFAVSTPELTDTHSQTDTPRLTNTPRLSDIARLTNNSRPTNTFRHTESLCHTDVPRQTNTFELTSLRQSTETTSHTETPLSTNTLQHNDCPRRSDSSPPVRSNDLNSTSTEEASSSQSNEARCKAALKTDPMGINFDRPKYPSYAILAERISSYNTWPAAMTQTPRDMALAGFFYAGYGDYTRCFFCGGGLRNWDPGDDPWVEHARWFPKCAFVRQNRGQEFIDLVQKRAAELDQQGNQEEMDNQLTQPSIGDPNSAQAKEEKVMKSSAITAIKEMGYSEEKIKAAIHTIKSRLPRGKHKVSAQEILEVIFELNPSKSRTPVGQSERVSNHDHKEDQTTLKPELIALLVENRSNKHLLRCKVCLDKNVSIVFLPCGHLVCCKDCALHIQKCPMCRQMVISSVRINDL